MMAFLFQGGPEDGRVMFFNSRAPKAIAFLEPQRKLVQYRLADEPKKDSIERCAGLYVLELETTLPDCPASRKLEGMNRKQADAN